MALISKQFWQWKEHTRKSMTRATQQREPGETALIRGRATYYQLDEKSELPLLICIHGWTTASYVWEPLRPRLQHKGYRVLTYDLFGRGFSDRPTADHTAEFFVRQLNDLLEHLKLNDQPFSVVGYSMGGAIAARFASERLHQIERLLLIAPAGMKVRSEWMRKVLRKNPRLLSPHVLALLPPVLRRTFRKEAAPYQHDPLVRKVVACQLRELEYRGYLPSLLSSLNGVLSSKMEKEHRTIARSGIPIRAIFAENDTTIPSKDARRLFDRWHGPGKSTIIADAGHGVPYTHRKAVMTAAQGFL
ncbi:alpha/beta hydrolase [Shimia sp. R9_1]|uniref:alpha/beta fold hydrolase n=1 Tax=Shimia sp. R9_1 TaxID=2821111 RepID=UPI001ADA9EC9|nr:alpha/beta hydrolase [Shimia sp. R9_1]MBO9409654.1 alpha/beta hydrolase [Shimia sp. R9_1]